MKMTALFLITFFSITAIHSCVSTGGDENILDTNLANQPLKSVTLKTGQTFVSYASGAKNAKVEILTCTNPDFKKTALINHGDASGFTKEKVCKEWSAQAFANQQYNVVAINRPGFGESTGTKDFSGSRSQTAILASLESLKFIKSAPIVTVWGYSTGSIAAAFVSKKIPTAKHLILGNGIFDTETLAAKPVKSRTIQAELSLMLRDEGEDGHEDRSLEWDVEGLPKTIMLYHSKLDPVISYKRAESVRTTLATAEYIVQLYPVKDAQHEIDWPTHQQVLRSILTKLK